MGLIVGSARIDENGKVSGGQAGDQTGKEVCTQAYYTHSKGWYVVRAKNIAHANALAVAMQQACTNDNIGYDQSNRNGVITQLKNYGALDKIAVATECDCSALVRACVLQATGVDVGNITTANEATALENSGLFEPRQSVTGEAMLYNGDILVTKTKGHTVIVVSGRARENAVAQPTQPTAPKPTGNSVIKLGQQHTINYTGHNIAVDGYYGKETKANIVRCFQKAMNSDYKKKLAVDGICGSGTKSVLGNHYVKYGEHQELVRAVQVALYCYGYDPQGTDAIYGNNTKKAVIQFQRDHGLIADGVAGRNTILKLMGC